MQQPSFKEDHISQIPALKLGYRNLKLENPLEVARGNHIYIVLFAQSVKKLRAKAQKCCNHFDRKAGVVDKGRFISMKQRSKFYIHGKDRKIQLKRRSRD